MVPPAPELQPRAGRGSQSSLLELLRCLDCGARLELTADAMARGNAQDGVHGRLTCDSCGADYAMAGGTARMVSVTGRSDVKRQTAESFAYEWERFGALRNEWRKNFLDYMRPHDPDWFAGKLVLDVGTGSGRHSYYASQFGARVVAVDLGKSIDVARQNLPPEVLTVQADAENLPFEEGTFDLVMSIGVLHHMPDPGRALRSIARMARPGGDLQIYLYWQPPWRWHRILLRVVSLLRTATVRMPHRALHAICYPVAALLFAAFVLPYRWMRRVKTLHPVAELLPLKAYADYPFAVCVNDQFDRFSAPLERRFEREEVDALLASAGLEKRQVIAHNGWIGSARRPT